MIQMKILPAIWLGKLVAKVSRLFNFGSGSTWPGHLALILSPEIITFLSGQIKKGIILVAGTNGKTTTAKMVRTILEQDDRRIERQDDRKTRVVHNKAGANLLNGIASALISASDWRGKIKMDFAIFEVDENTLPLALEKISPQVVLLLNLFRDQLDRYGEIDLIAEKWQKALLTLSDSSQVILNADDPQVALLGKNLQTKVSYFGLEDPKIGLKEKQHAMDSVYCPSCGKKLNFSRIYFSHLGDWSCPQCQYRRPKMDLNHWDYPLPGVYNRYNTLAAVLVAQKLGIEEKQIKNALIDFQPAFGRQEEFWFDGKRVKILLAKNPTGFNESIRTIGEMKGKKTVLLVLNDRIPDGRDVSWIWDVDFEELDGVEQIIVSGDRAYDMGLRIKYSVQSSLRPEPRASSKFPSARAEGEFKVPFGPSRGRGQSYNSKLKIMESLKGAIREGLKMTQKNEVFYILPTYSAMLAVRKILTGRKIL